MWQNVKPLFSDKQDVKSRNIIIIENNTVISKKTDLAEKFNHYFVGGGSEVVDSGNTSFPSIDSPIKKSFVLNNKKIKKDEPTLSLNELITKNNEKLIIGHLNINFIENKFEALVSLVKDKLDIIMISETKIDESFPESQFTMEGYSKPFRRHRNSHGGGLLIYISDDIPCKEIRTHKLPDDIEGIFIEIK